MTKLTLDDIADIREYEREREAFRAHVIALKKKRRIALGPIVTLVFENRDTIRFQIQEMARAERIFTDEGIQTELDIYNPLVPEPGRLAATLFIELTSKDELMTWLPKLVGIERSIELVIGDPDAEGDAPGHVVACTPEPSHEERLTREEITASVHYVWFELDPQQRAALATAPLRLRCTHPEYRHEVALGADTAAELHADAH